MCAQIHLIVYVCPLQPSVRLGNPPGAASNGAGRVQFGGDHPKRERGPGHLPHSRCFFLAERERPEHHREKKIKKSFRVCVSQHNIFVFLCLCRVSGGLLAFIYHLFEKMDKNT